VRRAAPRRAGAGGRRGAADQPRRYDRSRARVAPLTGRRRGSAQPTVEPGGDAREGRAQENSQLPRSLGALLLCLHGRVELVGRGSLGVADVPVQQEPGGRPPAAFNVWTVTSTGSAAVPVDTCLS
jgi:hypothetical protein